MPNLSHHCRKIIRVGDSTAVVIPPHVLDHLGAAVGDFLIWDLNVPRFAVISIAPVPPYINDPTLFKPHPPPAVAHPPPTCTETTSNKEHLLTPPL